MYFLQDGLGFAVFQVTVRAALAQTAMTGLTLTRSRLADLSRVRRRVSSKGRSRQSQKGCQESNKQPLSGDVLMG
jgi:hypothetical protein